MAGMTAPETVLGVTTVVGCKVACSYCPQGTFTRAHRRKATGDGSKVMDPERFRTFLSTVPTSVKISFAGHSEPFLNAHCTELILHAAGKGHRVGVNTTLVDFPVAQLDRLAGVAFENFILHLPGFIDGVANENMPVDEVYLASLAGLLDRKIPTLLRIHGEATHPEVQDLLDERGASVERRGIRAFAGAVDLAKNALFGDRNVRRNTRHEGPMGICPRIYQNILLPDGDVTLCCQDWEQRHILGNLGRDRWEDLANSAEMAKIRAGFDDDTIDTLCRVCEDAPVTPSRLERAARRVLAVTGLRRPAGGVAPSWRDRDPS
jgi:Iron-sulfur cluster-binding domain